MSEQQHTVLLLLVLIVLIRLLRSGRLARAYNALFSSIAAKPAPKPTPGTGTEPTKQGA